MRVIAKSLVLGALVLLAASPARAQSQENEAMAQRVAGTLKESGRLKNYRVAVQYQDGIAWLSGTVSSRAQKETAEALTAETEGVMQVVNRLEIIGQQQPEIDGPGLMPEATLAAAPYENERPVPARAASMPVQQHAASQLGPEPRPMAMPQSASGGMVRTAGPPIGHAPMPHGMGAHGMGAHGMAPHGMGMSGGPMPIGYSPQGMARTVSHDHPAMPNHAWPSYAAYPNYAALTYPQQYSAAAWPYIGPFYPYPQVPLGWRKVTLEWDDGWWFLDFNE